MIYLKKPLIFLVILTLAILLAGTAIASDEIKVFVNGSEMSFPDQKPVINSDNRTLVPVRFVSQALGAAVGWTEASKKVTVELGDKVLTLAIGKREATVGAYTITLDTAAALMNDRTMVPLRFISEGLGANVQWDDSTRTIYITTGAQEEELAAPFVGIPTGESFLRADTGEYAPIGEYMYVTADQLPVKFGDTTIYSVTPGADTIAVKMSNPTNSPLQMLIIQDGIVIGGRNDGPYKTSPFTAQYDTKNRADESLGAPRVDINKVNAFVFTGIKDKPITYLYLIVDNPINAGDWQP
jgi:hypothetical protein